MAVLHAADQNIDAVAAAFAAFDVDAGYLVPTETGLRKSIMDAHAGLRAFLALRGLHDFSVQKQGPSNRVVLGGQLVGVERVDDVRISLYRPTTKKGDPRIWITGLPTYASAGNLLALLTDSSGQLFVVNCSNPEIFDSRNVEGAPLNLLLTDGQVRAATDELLARLRSISAQGFITASGFGDHTVGDTLEALLGIPTNSRKTPDFKGIEIKSGRINRSSGKKSIFSQVPDWKSSPLGSARELLDRFGYVDKEKGRLQLYCTVTTHPNPHGFFLAVDHERGVLEHRVGDPTGSSELLVQWNLSTLDDRLLSKHRETFWVKAEADFASDGGERFWYTHVTHTKVPLVANLRHLLSTGRVMVDFTLSKRDSGTVRDHGYLFRIADRDIPLLFSDPVEYQL